MFSCGGRAKRGIYSHGAAAVAAAAVFHDVEEGDIHPDDNAAQ